MNKLIKKIPLILSLVILLVNKVYSQFPETEIPSFVDPRPGNELVATPDVMAFQKYNFMPVNLYTGKVQVNIPIYEINSGKIKVPISITYNSGGVKVEDVASNVGLGWNLNAGGAITKEVRDLDDQYQINTHFQVYDDYDGTFMYYGEKVSFIGYHRLNGLTPAEFVTQTEQGANAIEVDKVDSSPDIYYINAPGLNNKFFLKTHNSNFADPFLSRTYEAIFLNKTNCLMAINHRSEIDLSSIFGFNGDEDGNPYQYYSSPTQSYLGWKKYDFSNFNFSKNGLYYSFSKKNIIETRNLPVERSYSYFLTLADNFDYNMSVSSWLLTSIFDQTTNREILFDYETYQRDNVNPIANLKSRPAGAVNNSCFFDFFDYSIDGSSNMIFSNKTLIKYPKINRIKKIEWDNGKIVFNYNLNRLDAIGEKALTEILVKTNDNKLIKKFIFNYSYLNSKEGCTEPVCKRLILNSVIEKSVDNINSKTYAMEYEYTNPLPKRTSLQRDFLGYYNNNGSSYSFSDDYYNQGPRPTLYFYPNQGRYSYLPFQKVNTSTSYVLNGDYSLEPNNYSLTGLLKKITYPTGGFSTFEYENSKFNFEGEDYIAGSARIKKQHLNDGNGNDRFIEYSYLTKDGKSSGAVNNIPLFAYPSNNDYSYAVTFDKPKSGLELTDGSFIGYSRIIETEIGNGHTEYDYTNPKTNPNTPENTILARNYDTYNHECRNFLLNNSAFPGISYTNNEIKRHKLIHKYIYDENNLILKKYDYEYDYKLFNTINLEYPTKVYIEPSPPSYDERMFFKVNSTSSINIERNLLKKETVTDYFNGGSIVNTSEYIYDTDFPFIKEKKVIYNNSEIKTNIYYPLDSEVSGEPYMSTLIYSNRISEPIKIKTYKDNTLISTKKYNYGYFGNYFGNYIFNHKSMSISKGNNLFEEGIIIDLRDEKANVISYHNKANVYTTLIWGYNKTKPIAKIENITYDDIPTTELNALNNFNYATGTETQLLTALQNLRNALPSTAMVTTMTYKPLVGISTVTDPKNDKKTYHYDSFNRLEFVKDSQGNILQENNYHFKE